MCRMSRINYFYKEINENDLEEPTFLCQLRPKNLQAEGSIQSQNYFTIQEKYKKLGTL